MTTFTAPDPAAGTPSVFPEHRLAHEMLDGLSGLEVGAASHNPFGLRTRNVATREGWEFYAREQRAMGVEPAPVDVWGSADAIPVGDQSEDFVVSSHVVEHLPNPVAAFIEWDRVVRDGGYVFMIVPIKGVLPEDGPRELTTLDELIECYRRGYTVESHPIDGVPGGRMGHYHTFTPDSLTDLVDWMREQKLCDWELAAREDVDSKVGNGFTLAFRVHHPGGRSGWRPGAPTAILGEAPSPIRVGRRGSSPSGTASGSGCSTGRPCG